MGWPPAPELITIQGTRVGVGVDLSGADPGGGGGGRDPPALDHQFFFSTNFLTKIARNIRSVGWA